MKEKIVDKYLHLRLLVGYLGESEQFGWWQTTLLQSRSRSFLDPVFARTSKLAQYHGVREAARRLHDEHIGLAASFPYSGCRKRWNAIFTGVSKSKPRARACSIRWRPGRPRFRPWRHSPKATARRRLKARSAWARRRNC